ncbi:ankyrin repeat and SOCS box protein 13-like isoform X1 [Penaeus chinensis]|uniref:ankyrin repeat and SOCS box protein 13-like isoform X1 n=2 Tax=Penaeus chinensis TaxID=139456 RepID=UPI001FB7015E|nr:ankyrin repeat and SOCS box protein 13-like isoform X1 [Penaeus chinensis]
MEEYSRTNMFPLHNAVASRNFNEVQRLLADGHDVNELHYDRVTPLHMACLSGDLKTTQYLLDRGAWVDAQSIDNSTPLCDACAGGSLECVKLLLQQGASVNPPLLLSTPLHEAALRGHTQIVALLIQEGARLNCNDLHYGTPLHAACSMQRPSISCIHHLLKSGASVNALKNHKTPLHLIAMNSKSEAATELLIAYGANVYLKDCSGCTPRNLAGPNTSMEAILSAFERDPRPLTQWCRLAIRSQLGPRGIKLIDQLEAPTILTRFLQ